MKITPSLRIQLATKVNAVIGACAVIALTGVLAAKELGGSLTAHSEGLGRGATFTLDLPLESAAHISVLKVAHT